jgi:hypothetical protein
MQAEVGLEARARVLIFTEKQRELAQLIELAEVCI